jgi:formylglycine-generating enzyme required for sulfatase activity
MMPLSELEGLEYASAAPPEVDAAAPAPAAAPRAPDASLPAEASVAAPEGMLLVPGGTYQMGRDEGGEGDERPAHPVTVRSFWLDRTEVTQAAYDECVKAGICRAPDAESINAFRGLFKGPNKPIVGISWHDGTKYCGWKGKRLPKEAEFERAVRGDDGRRFPWGNDAPTKELAVFDTGSPEEVGTHPLGKGPYGHDDLAGNVWEWIDDDYDPFAYARGRVGTCDEILAAQDQLRKEHKQGFTGTNPIPTVCEKTIRGGAYNYPAYGLRSTNRVHHPAGFRLRMTGVRCAKDS